MRLLPCLLAAVAVAVQPLAARSSDAIYLRIDADGTMHFSDVRYDDRFELILRLSIEAPPAQATSPGTLPGSGLADRASAAAMDALIVKMSRASGVDPALVHAVITVESNYRASAVSPKGAIGLMQVMPPTGRRYGIVNLTDPESNLAAGTAYLRDLLRLFGDDLNLALAAYNAGENAVLRFGRKIPPYPETQAYVPRVLAHYRALRAAFMNSASRDKF